MCIMGIVAGSTSSCLLPRGDKGVHGYYGGYTGIYSCKGILRVMEGSIPLRMPCRQEASLPLAEMREATQAPRGTSCLKAFGLNDPQ